MSTPRTTQGLTLALAEMYASLGWQAIPIPRGEKGPRIREWQRLRPSPADLRTWFGRGGSNVGVLLGEPSASLVDVDLDCPEAVTLAPRFLPETWVFGREGKPRSHWLFTAPGATTEKFTDDAPNGGQVMLVELRATGCQTVFPPSLHPSGETIAFDAELGDSMEAPREVDAGDLFNRTCRLAMACILVRAGWSAEAAVTEAMNEKPPVAPASPPARTRASARVGGNAVERASRYLSKMAPAISGQAGHQATWSAALALVRGFGLGEDDALRLLTDEYNPRCQPPWSLRELQHKVAQAAASSHLPHGYLLEGKERHV